MLLSKPTFSVSLRVPSGVHAGIAAISPVVYIVSIVYIKEF